MTGNVSDITDRLRAEVGEDDPGTPPFRLWPAETRSVVRDRLADLSCSDDDADQLVVALVEALKSELRDLHRAYQADVADPPVVTPVRFKVSAPPDGTGPAVLHVLFLDDDGGARREHTAWVCRELTIDAVATSVRHAVPL